MSDPIQIPEAFDAIARLCIALEEHPITKYPECWECKIDEQWWIAVNGHDQTKPARSPNGASASVPFEVKPFHCYVEFNGWPAGIITPTGGFMAAGEAANENELIEAIERRIEQIRGA